MINKQFMRERLRAGTALRALALLGAGVGISAIATPTMAQDFQNVTASGRVQSTTGKPVSGATVELRSDSQGFVRTATTGGDGSFRIPQLPPGNYTVTITAPGFDAYTETALQLTQANAANQFTLASAGAAASGGDIVVTAGRVQTVDFEQNTTGAVIKVSDLANRVPVARDLTSIIQLAPGTAAGDSAFGNLASVAGSSVAENAYYVNGLNITNFRNFLGSNSVPFEFYDTIEVKNGGYAAEFGRATGGFVNATTRSGSNDFHTGAIITWQPRELRDTSPNTLSQDNDGDYAEDLRADFYVSGPLIKDHLFFYGLYESRNVNSGGGTNTGIYQISKTDSPFFAGKVDAVITDGQRLEFTYFRTTGESRNSTYSYDPTTNNIGAYRSTTISQYGGDNYVGRYTGTFTNWLTVSAAYGKSNDRDNTLSNTPTIPYIADFRVTPTDTSLGNPVASVSTHEDTREFYRADADLYFKLLGSHHIRGGYERENLKTKGISSYTGGSAYSIYNSATYGPYAIRRTFEGGGEFKTKNTAFYIEDNWQLLDNRLTLQLGLRNDKFENFNIEDTKFYDSGSQWGPRVGFSLDPIGDARTKVYGSFSRYFLPIAANTNIRLAGAEYDVRDYFLYQGIGADGNPILGAPLNLFSPCLRTSNTNCRITADGNVTPTTNTVAKNLKPQSADEYILGAEQRLGRRWKLGVYGTYRKLNAALEDAAIDQAALAYCSSQGFSCSSVYTGFSQYVLLNPGSDSTITLFPVNGEATGRTVDFTAAQLGYPKAERVYKAMTFTFDREFDGVWSLSGSYTLAATTGNYEGAVKSDNGQTDAGLTQDFDQPGFTNGAYGYLPNHRRHNFKLYGSYKVTDMLLLGINGTVQSPRKYGCIGVIPSSIDPFASAYGAAGNYCRFANGEVSDTNPIALVRRGTAFESDWRTQIDVSAAITLPTDAFSGVLRFDVFNVLNSKSVVDLNEFGGNDDLTLSARTDYKTPLSYQAPRYARVQLQLRF